MVTLVKKSIDDVVYKFVYKVGRVSKNDKEKEDKQVNCLLILGEHNYFSDVPAACV